MTHDDLIRMQFMMELGLSFCRSEKHARKMRPLFLKYAKAAYKLGEPWWQEYAIGMGWVPL